MLAGSRHVEQPHCKAPRKRRHNVYPMEAEMGDFVIDRVARPVRCRTVECHCHWWHGGYIPEFSGSTTVQNSSIWQSSSGYIGIGTQSPGNALSVNGIISAGGTYFNVLAYALNNTPTYGHHGELLAISGRCGTKVSLCT